MTLTNGKKTGLVLAALAAFTMVTPSFAGGDLAGLKVLVTNTFTGAPTKGVETDVGRFGMNNNLFSIVGDAIELPSFIDLYDIDFGDTSVSFTWVETETSMKFGGDTPEGSNDRNYFVFDLPADKAITAVTFDAAGSTLLEGSAEPTAMVVTRNKIVTSFAGGVIRKPGFAPRFVVTVGDAK